MLDSIDRFFRLFLYRFCSGRPNPRWMVFVVDCLVASIAIILAYLLRFNFAVPSEYFPQIWLILPGVVAIKAFLFWIFRTYSSTIRHSGFNVLMRAFWMNLTAAALFLITDFVCLYLLKRPFILPFSIVIIDFSLTILGMVFLRLIIRLAYIELTRTDRDKIRTVILGSREQAILIKRALELHREERFQVQAILDRNKANAGIDLDGVRTYYVGMLKEVILKYNINVLVFIKDGIPSSLKDQIVDICLEHHVKIRTIPNFSTLFNGVEKIRQLKDISVEELLERDPIQLNNDNISEFLNNKTILITGAAGSIGSEIARQIIRFNPKLLILLDQAETPLHSLQLELQGLIVPDKYKILLGDIRNKEKMDFLFSVYHPDIVYHAAAYKHVPLMELNPSEAIQTNVVGTMNLAGRSAKYDVKKFIMISTDKAVNPTNIMGASKRIAEMYIQALQNNSTTQFITTRFGNVLGSNGSVIPLFKQQIEQGGPVTVTHPDITRYFMTIPEACQLVLEASTLGHGGEIFMFNMGQRIRIADLARKMIMLAGFVPDKDIQIKYIGLRPGEKLYEELLYNQELSLPTNHPEIVIAKTKPIDFDDLSAQIKALQFCLQNQDIFTLVKKMKEIVPEYISNNSVFCELDKKISQRKN